MTREQKLEEALRELVDLTESVRAGDYTPDSFTCQPARTALDAPEAKRGKHKWEPIMDGSICCVHCLDEWSYERDVELCPRNPKVDPDAMRAALEAAQDAALAGKQRVPAIEAAIVAYLRVAGDA